MTTINKTMTIDIEIDDDGVVLGVGENEVHVTVDDLQRAGWEYAPGCERAHCSEGDCIPVESLEAEALDVLRRWHDDTHPGPFKFCYEQPCHGMRQAVEAL